MQLDRIGRYALLIQAVVIGGLATTGLVMASRSPTGVSTVVGFQLNLPHSVLLLGTAVMSALAASWTPISRAWAVIQATGFTLLFLIGSASSAGRPQDTWLGLNAADNFLHLGLALLGGVLGTAMLVRPAAIPIPRQEQDGSAQNSFSAGDESSEQAHEMTAAEVAVAEGHASAEQARRVQEDAEQRSASEHRRAWQRYRENQGG